MTGSQLFKLDDRDPALDPGDVVCVVGLKNELARLPHFLDYYRELGVNRFFIMDNESSDGSDEFILEQPDCHCFRTVGSHFINNTLPPNWTNAVLNVHCTGHWCVVVDGDELLVYPGSETLKLRDFCGYLEASGADSVMGCLIDMYGDGPMASFRYEPGRPFLEAAPFFDPEPGWWRPHPTVFPPVQAFGGVRERVFWKGRFLQTFPPCLSKVPLVRWERGRRYLSAQHTINLARLSPVEVGILHFKFMHGMDVRASSELGHHRGVEEKGLQERVAYIEALERDPDLALRNAQSVRYEGTRQLVELGLMRSAPDLDRIIGVAPAAAGMARMVSGARR